MPIPLLKSYYKEASKYGGVLVFKGLLNGSFKDIGQLVREIHGDMPEDQRAGSIIDDTAFERFGINNVPAFVLYKEEECYGESSCNITYDKIIGNIGVKASLFKFEEEGDLREDAAELLNDS
jgi:type-F conjugative transfer system pilin assembly protein TrbC